ncbi:hypothetical protein [Marinitenerispora sediminis]|uniref:Uncharacterized protein n=1 Tax=Marinitenerispora sediminis TaxID=1931232 RepID=A0A368T1V0_9ACTN|nr:hypothetical protein [Marinitenerispora sediminis]RCV48887.1 hypothetical protein DEF28_22345 [Marinitenerispora sediminis]RCV51337.1 hypothetical protein DEF23_20630 [Marinitenerispora sediminis]RCV54924.1 hypothetical protein DEF24_18650 [Marinitenerispora sediminis]
MTLERGNAFTPVASATMIWPWGTATAAGAVLGAVDFLFSLNQGLGAIPDALGTAILAFALVGGGVALLGRKGDRRARRYAGQYPWRFAMVPAALGGAGSALLTFIGGVLGGSLVGALFGAVLSGVAAAAVIWVILGIIGMVAGNKSA